MNDKPQIKLSETVVLIDAAFLNFVITDMKGYFEETLQRSLQEIDLSMLTTYLTLDAGITEGKMKCNSFLLTTKTQVILRIAILLIWKKS